MDASNPPSQPNPPSPPSTSLSSSKQQGSVVHFDVLKISKLTHLRVSRVIEIDLKNGKFNNLRSEGEVTKEYHATEIKAISRSNSNPKRVKIEFDTDYTAIFQSEEDASKFMDVVHTLRRLHDKHYLEHLRILKSRIPNIETARLRIYASTWNMGNAPPPANVAEMLPSKLSTDVDLVDCGYDILVFAVQEASFPVSGDKAGWSTDPCNKVCFEAFQGMVGDLYDCIAQQKLWEIRIFCFVRKNLVPYISSIQTGTEATGIAHVVGNKGGVAVAMRIFDESIVFLGSHLAAHQGKVKQRASNYYEIVNNIVFDGIGMEDMMTGPNHIIWMGDLNYRIDLPRSMVVDYIEDDNLNALLAFDQLSVSMNRSEIFPDFVEYDIAFPPTYKMVLGSKSKTDYTTEKSRVPSWCDRILVRSLPLGTFSSVLPHPHSNSNSHSNSHSNSIIDLMTTSIPIPIPHRGIRIDIDANADGDGHAKMTANSSSLDEAVTSVGAKNDGEGLVVSFDGKGRVRRKSPISLQRQRPIFSGEEDDGAGAAKLVRRSKSVRVGNVLIGHGHGRGRGGLTSAHLPIPKTAVDKESDVFVFDGQSSRHFGFDELDIDTRKQQRQRHHEDVPKSESESDDDDDNDDAVIEAQATRRRSAAIEPHLVPTSFLSKRLVQTSYDSCPQITSSDHKPVFGTFVLDAQLPFYDNGKYGDCEVRISGLRAGNLTSADKNGFSDPYIVMSFPSAQSVKTSVHYKTLNPIWSDLDVPVLRPKKTHKSWMRTQHVKLKVLDFDVGRSDDCLGYSCIGLYDACEGPVNFEVGVYLHGKLAGVILGIVQVVWIEDSDEDEDVRISKY